MIRLPEPKRSPGRPTKSPNGTQLCVSLRISTLARDHFAALGDGSYCSGAREYLEATAQRAISTSADIVPYATISTYGPTADSTPINANLTPEAFAYWQAKGGGWASRGARVGLEEAARVGKKSEKYLPNRNRGDGQQKTT